jgi:hypothetical protein
MRMAALPIRALDRDDLGVMPAFDLGFEIEFPRIREEASSGLERTQATRLRHFASFAVDMDPLVQYGPERTA